MCDPTTSTAHITFVDMQNAYRYARMRVLYEQNQASPNKDLSWVWTNSDQTPSYTCPRGLTCYDGYFRINNRQKCQELGQKGFQQYRTADNAGTVKPSAQTGYFLEWRGSDAGGDCYMANPVFAKQCMTNNFDNHPDNDGKKRATGLFWDSGQGKCFITKDYCDSIGDASYKPGPEANGNGGVCELSAGQKAADFFLGSTVARGLIGGACNKM
jgi:hypothetical protein